MCNGQVRALNIMEFEDFFDRVGDTSGIMMTSRLERLRISSTFSPSKRSHVSALVLILKHCPILAELKLSAGDPDNLYSILELVNRQSSLIPNLNDLELKSPEALVNVSFSQRKIVNIRLTMLSDDPFSDRQKLLQLYGLSYLDTGSSTVEESNPRLSIWNLATSIRDTQKRLDSSLGWSSFSITIERCLGDMMGSVKVVLYFSTGSTTPATWTIVKMGVPLAPEMTMFYLELFRDFGWSVYTLETNDGFTDEFAFALDASTRERGSTIEILELNPKSLSLDGLEAMDRVIERSQDLPRLELCLRNLEIKTEVQKAKYLIDRYHENVKSLTFSGISAREWLSDVAEICDTGSGFPKLDSFVLECSDRPEITHEQAQWIASMVSTPTQQSSTSHPGSGACLMELEPNITVPERVPFTWQPRRRVVIPDLQLGHDDWKMVIEALDFSVLRALDLNRTNFSVLELEHLVDCIPSQSNSVDGLNIVLHKSDLESAPADVVHEQLLLLWEKAPWVRVFVSM
ncbi:hypothetical protein B0O80DRAFT_448179 [Mortierella sp. GBAus27b]|nr:hypothetical protein B0O80DRAFT_448179 [Mortierella sp. GBAus27b]